MGLEKNFQINSICISVNAVPELEIVFFIPAAYRLTTSIYPSTIMTSFVSDLKALALSRLKTIRPFL